MSNTADRRAIADVPTEQALQKAKQGEAARAAESELADFQAWYAGLPDKKKSVVQEQLFYWMDPLRSEDQFIDMVPQLRQLRRRMQREEDSHVA